MNATQSIELYTILFYVSLTVAALGLASAVGLFFLLDIPTVFALMTGRAKRQTIERISKESESGKLRKQEEIRQMLDQTSGNLKKKRQTSIHPEEQNTTSLEMEERNTTVLSQEEVNTTVLCETNDVQGGMSDGMTAQLTKQPVQVGRFEITEATVLIHTNEEI